MWAAGVRYIARRRAASLSGWNAYKWWVGWLVGEARPPSAYPSQAGCQPGRVERVWRGCNASGPKGPVSLGYFSPPAARAPPASRRPPHARRLFAAYTSRMRQSSPNPPGCPPREPARVPAPARPGTGYAGIVNQHID